jgi:hypothetical protein
LKKLGKSVRKQRPIELNSLALVQMQLVMEVLVEVLMVDHLAMEDLEMIHIAIVSVISFDNGNFLLTKLKYLKTFVVLAEERSRSRYDDYEAQWQSDYRSDRSSPTDDRRSSLGNSNRLSGSSLKKTSESATSNSNVSVEAQKEVNLFDFDDPPVTSTTSNQTVSNDFGMKISYVLFIKHFYFILKKIFIYMFF